MVEGRLAWLARLKAEGKRAPCGRKPKDAVRLADRLNPKQLLDLKAGKADLKRALRDCRRRDVEEWRKAQADVEAVGQEPVDWIQRMREGRERAIAEPAYLKWLNAGGATPDILPVYEVLSAKVDCGPRRPKRDYY
jgi:hypothetical protein